MLTAAPKSGDRLATIDCVSEVGDHMIIVQDDPGQLIIEFYLRPKQELPPHLTGNIILDERRMRELFLLLAKELHR